MPDNTSPASDNSFQDDAAPPPPITRHVEVDQGLNDWANLVHDHLTNQNGVEITARTGSATHFKFRGQTFSVHVQRVG